MIDKAIKNLQTVLFVLQNAGINPAKVEWLSVTGDVIEVHVSKLTRVKKNRAMIAARFSDLLVQSWQAPEYVGFRFQPKG